LDRQLQVIADDLHATAQRLRRLDAAAPGAAWHRRPGPDRWSAADCIAHLNLTSEALLPLVRGYRRDLLGWLIWTLMTPSTGFKTRTIPAFVPTRTDAPERLIVEFDRLQNDLLSCVAAADGLPIDRVKVASPFDQRVRYNLYAVLTLVPRHQQRHLVQAERAASVFEPAESAVAV
jgi:DinB superfamily